MHTHTKGNVIHVPGLLNPVEGIDVYGLHENWARATCSSGALTLIGWTEAVTNSGSANTDYAAVKSVAAEGGIYITTTAGTDNKGARWYCLFPFLPAAGKQIYFRTKIKTSAVVGAPNLFFGLSDAATAAVLAAATIGDTTHAGFYTLAGYTLVAASKNDNAGTAETGATGQSITTTYKVLEIVVNGVTSVDFFIDKVLVKTLNTYPPSGAHPLNMTITVENGGANAENISIPFVECWETV